MNKRQTDNALNDTKVEKVKHFSELKQERQKSDIMILNKEN